MGKSFKCDQCPKIYATRQGRWRHKRNDHKEISLMMVKPERTMNLAESIKSSHADGDTSGALQDVQDPASDIPTFDSAEFCGKKPLSDETLIKIRKMLKIPRHPHASIVKEEREQAPEKSNGLHHNYSDEVEKDIDSSEGESMDESGSEQTDDESGVDMEENGESDEVDGKDMEKLEDEEEAPLDNATIRNLIKRFKILHHQLIHQGRKEHVPILEEIITILNDEGQLGDEYDRTVKSVTKYQ